MRGYIKTIHDLEQMYYIDPQERQYLTKTDAPVITTTTGVYNPIYGAKTWIQLNQEINAWSVLPKIPWNQSGWRVITARGDTPPTGGVAEDGAIPDTIKPTWATVSTKPKTVVHAFSASEVQQFLGTVDDSIGDTMAALREYFSAEHAEHLNKMLLTDNDTLAGNNVESIDRIVGSYSEINGVGQDTGDLDIYSLDRDGGASWADAYVDHNSGTDRTFTMDMLDTAIRTIKVNSGYKPNVILTGEDTLDRILQEQLTMQRYTDTKPISVGVNGVTVEGINTGFSVATYRDIPIITSKDVPKDTISRVYFLNTDFLKIKVAKPTQYFETGMSKGDPFGIDKIGDEGMYRTMAELICFNFRAQGKIRDLK